MNTNGSKWPKEKIKARLTELHAKENDLNKQIGQLSYQIRELITKKEKIRRRISANMLYRNKLIDLL